MFDTMKDNIDGYFGFISWIVKEFGSLIVTLLEFDYGSATDTAVTSAATALTGLFLAMEYISYFSSMRMEGRIEDAIQLCMKLVIAKIIVENSSYIIGGIYEMFRSVGVDSVKTGFQKLQEDAIPAINNEFINDNGLFLGIGYVIICMVLMLVCVVVVVMMMSLAVQIIGIIFEIAIHQVVGPIAISTLCCGATRSTGISFIKSYTAVCLQTTVIGVIFNVFGTIYQKISEAGVFGESLKTKVESTGVFGYMFNFLLPILMMMILVVTVKKSGEITKRMFGA